MSKIIIHIDGIQGSGKSYICSQIKHIRCVDTDDIYKQAIKIIDDSQMTNNKIPRTVDHLTQIKNMIVNYYIKNNNKIVFVGITDDIPLATHKFFIKIIDFTSVYKRLLLRELEKIVTNYSKIKKCIKDEIDPKEIDIQRVAELSILFPATYDEFMEDYIDRLQRAKQKKYIPKTQEQIIKIINNI
jgi:hypothetical protein